MTRISVEEWISDDGLTGIMGMARDGLTVEDIASRIGIGTRTLYDWMKRYPQISQAIKEGRAPADTRVENALYRRAVGYDYVEKTETVMPDGTVTTRTVTRHVPGNVTAMIMWLKNRKPKVWRDHPTEQTEEENGCGVIVLPARDQGEPDQVTVAEQKADRI